MNEADDLRDHELAREGTRKAERLARARRLPIDVWSSLVRVVGLGWVLALPLALGAIIGRLVARWLDRPALALVGLALGLAAGVYGVYRQLKLGLANDDLEPIASTHERSKDEKDERDGNHPTDERSSP